MNNITYIRYSELVLIPLLLHDDQIESISESSLLEYKIIIAKIFASKNKRIKMLCSKEEIEKFEIDYSVWIHKSVESGETTYYLNKDMAYDYEIFKNIISNQIRSEVKEVLESEEAMSVFKVAKRKVLMYNN